MKAAPRHVRLCQRLAFFVLEHQARRSVTDESFQHRGQPGANAQKPGLFLMERLCSVGAKGLRGRPCV